MLGQTAKAYYQKEIEDAIQLANDDIDAFSADHKRLVTLVEYTSELAKMADHTLMEAGNKSDEDYIEKRDTIKELLILVSCILRNAYNDPFYFQTHYDVAINLLSRGKRAGDLIDAYTCNANKEYDVHFQLNSYMRITAKSEQNARDIMNAIIENARSVFEDELCVGFESDDYTTDVLLDSE